MPMQIRPAVPGDAAAIARAHVASWQAAYRELLPQAFLDALSVAERTELWRNSLAKKVPVLIAEQGGEVAGFIALGPCRDQDAQPGIWEIWAMYLVPDCWSQGVGRALWLAAREACVALAQGRQLAMSPLYLVAPHGEGKSHLAAAVVHEARQAIAQVPLNGLGSAYQQLAEYAVARRS